MQGSVMPQARFSSRPSLTTIERPHCSHCTSRMMLARIGPGPMGFEHRRFECPKCNSVQNEVVAGDPMKSASAGWLAGQPRAPNCGHEMLDTQNQGPQCTACGSPMKLTAIEPSDVGHDLRTFACPQCKRVHRDLLASAL